ncbi:hypothetical protein D3C80_1828030 [compost metagenome]
MITPLKIKNLNLFSVFISIADKSENPKNIPAPLIAIETPYKPKPRLMFSLNKGKVKVMDIDATKLQKQVKIYMYLNPFDLLIKSKPSFKS